MSDKTSLLIIIADQLSFRALSFYGSEDVRAPNIDRFFKDAFVFENAYTTCPLCLPARSALWSGYFPHQTGAMSNGNLLENPDLSSDIQSLGERLSGAGYNCVHVGKTHDAGSLRGFDVIQGKYIEDLQSDTYVYNYDTHHDADTCEKACAQLDALSASDKPFALIADFNNPHNICNFTARAADLEPDAIANLPALPPNYEIDDMHTRPLPVQYLCCEHNRQQQAAHWGALQFQQYRAAYYHYIEILDEQLGQVFDALERNGQRDNTVVCLCADHGDNMGARKMTTKHCSFYEETAHVPLLFSGPGIKSGRSDILCSHLDLLPSFCSLLGVPVEDGLWGKDLSGHMCADAQEELHPYVISQWYSEWGTTIEPCRMLRTKQFKYTCYREENAEELYDLENDPYEMHNLINNDEYSDVLNEHRALFADYLKEQNDSFNEMDIKVDKRWRSHEPGFHNHHGPTAPQVEFG